MRELNRKVFKTIFILLSVFIIFIIILYNVQSYSKEYANIKRNLTFIEEKPNNNMTGPRDLEKDNPNPMNRELDNMMIMDYEVYTVKLNNNQIDHIINHGNISDIDITKIVNKVLNSGKGVNVGNLYNNKYSYNYNGDTIVIIITKNINNRLTITLIESLIILLVGEVIIYLISKSITKRITKPAEEAFTKQRDFIADASHELKTPLAVIIASSDELKSDKKNEKYVDNIKYESERMNNLIRNLLDLSKLESGVSTSNYKEEDISRIIERVCLTFEGIAFEENIKIKTNIKDNIIFKCSKEEIEKLISIIIDNAIKHSYKNTSIVVNMNEDKNTISIDITNSGDPISPGDEEKIFERFYRGDKSRNRDSNRYGLGLAIARNIVTNHNGTIKAFSKNNKTTFTVLLKK